MATSYLDSDAWHMGTSPSVFDEAAGCNNSSDISSIEVNVEMDITKEKKTDVLPGHVGVVWCKACEDMVTGLQFQSNDVLKIKYLLKVKILRTDEECQVNWCDKMKWCCSAESAGDWKTG